MKRFILLGILLLLGAWQAFAQYPIYTVRQLQEQPLDSLRLADSLQATQAARWTLQASPYIRHSGTFAGDTVTIIGLCVVPPRVLTYTAGGWTMLLYDTSGSPSPFGSVFVRATSDSAAHLADGFLNVQRGWIIQMTGVVSEFPTNYNSLTQLAPIPGIPIVQLATGRPIPPPPTVTIGQFYNGLFSGGTVKFSSGEQYEGKIVQLVNLTIDAKINTARGTFSMVDGEGNQISGYDASRYFTLGHGTIVGPPDSVWAIKYPSITVGARIDTIRGFIMSVSGSESPRGYRIAPVYRGDIVFGGVVPAAPALVSPPNGTANISSGILLKWGQTPTATKYRLRLATDSLFNTIVLDDSTIVDTARAVSGFSYLTGYYWKVSARNTAGWGPYSALWSFRTGGWVLSTAPVRNALNVDPPANITVVFMEDISPATLTNSTIRINGSMSGLHPGVITYNGGTRTVTINPLVDFAVGEVVTVGVTTGIQNAIGDPMTSPFEWSFTIGSLAGC